MSIDAQKLLEKGMKYQDWELIEEAQALLAAQNGGEAPKEVYVPPKTATQQETDDILAKAKEVTAQHENGEFGFDIRSGESQDRGDGSGKNARREPINTERVGAFNLFEDDLSEMVQDTKASQIESSDKGKSLYTGRSRMQRKAPIQLIDVVCLECDRKAKVAPKHARKVEGVPRYVCEKCIINKGKTHRM